MIWTDEVLHRLNVLIRAKLSSLLPSLPLNRQDQMGVWLNYCASVGLKMVIIPSHDVECRSDLPQPGGAIFLDGAIRLRNAWGDKYIDVPEEFAAKALALGFLP